MAAKKKSTKATKRSSKRGKETAKLAALMRGIDFCMMTTRRKDGALRARPMSNNGEVDFDGDAWFFSFKDSGKVRELDGDPHVALAYTGGTKRAPVWIHVEGRAKVTDDAKLKKELWVDELDRWFENGPGDPAVVLIHVVAKRAIYWSFEEQGEVVLG